MTELSNAVTVLIARMESHPEDFELSNGERYNKAKFGDVAGALYELVGMDKEKAGAYWFLNDADKQALLEAWKKYHRTAMEKEVMGKIFDDGSEEREAEARMKMRVQQQQLRQMQSTAIHPLQNSYPYAQNANAAQGMAIQGGGGHIGMTVSANGAVNMANTLSLGGETIDSSILKKLKDLIK